MTDELYLMKAKDPSDYIRRSLTVSLPSGKKAKITTVWLKQMGFTVKDIQHARHRNPYWKARKLEGNYERNRRRLAEHNYSLTGQPARWTEVRLRKFIELNASFHDFELARKFRTTIPSIQYMRRKFNAAKTILKRQGRSSTSQNLYSLMVFDEDKLHDMIK